MAKAKKTFKQAYAAAMSNFRLGKKPPVVAHVAFILLLTVCLGYPVLTELGVAFLAAVMLAPVAGVVLHFAVMLPLLAYLEMRPHHYDG